jgi:cell wall-associated NlpC family hydrolase
MRAEFVAAARSYLGAPWRHLGRKPWALDCVGLLIVAGKAVGIDVVAPRQYGREPWDDTLRKYLVQNFGSPVDEWQPGCVLLVRWGKGEPSHVGIMTDHACGYGMIHAHNLHGVIEQGLSGPLLACVEEVYDPWRA